MKKSNPTTTIQRAKKHMPDPVDISAKVVYKSIEKKAAPLVRKLENFKLVTVDDRDKAIDLTKELKEFAKEAQQKLRTVTDPLNQAIDAAKEIFKPFLDQVKVVDAQIKSEILAFDEKLESRKKKLEERFESGKVSTTKYLKESANLDNDKGTRRTWKAVAVDESQTPREYLIPDVAKITQALKDGKKVKGWAYEQVKGIAI